MTACFSFAWLEPLLIFIVIVIVAVAIFKLVLPWLLGLTGTPPGGPMVMTILGYILWGFVAIGVIIFAFDLFKCLWDSGLGLGRIPR